MRCLGVVGSRWFREGGGMPTLRLGPDSGRYLSFAEREEIALLRAQDAGVREIELLRASTDQAARFPQSSVIPPESREEASTPDAAPVDSAW
ncbi:hypothetical protein GCM10009760_54530 [Kitasatospora kazusensis]|uniref:Transposase IS30-like HTH domain-containing protein n=1 Tax=Kitasatospora kazusensis TaxID=407974 RepID=A0ABN3A7B2_9ACTN